MKAESEPLTAKPVAQVPAWFYDETVCNCMTKAAFLWWSNVVCAIFHLGFAIATIVVATSNGTGLDTPTLTVYTTRLQWQAGSVDMLVPSYEKSGTLLLAHITLWFFLLSFLAHALVAGFNAPQAFALRNERNREIGRFTGWYFLWIHECRNPARWIEYSFSAAVSTYAPQTLQPQCPLPPPSFCFAVLITIAVASGVNHVYMLAMAFVLIWCTMLFGAVTEILSPPLAEPDNAKPKRWANPSRLVRILPHLLGYVPYLTVWIILGDSFFSNISQGAGGNRGPPDFVYIIVIGQFVVFTLFGITQLVNQLHDLGAGWYYYGEFSYCLLSLVAKGFLGVLLLGNVFIYSTFEEAAAAV